MSFKYVLFYLGCAATWLILLPMLVVIGGTVLMAYAVFSEVSALFNRGTGKSLDGSTAREIAHRICVGH
jgi:hypothetical protein